MSAWGRIERRGPAVPERWAEAPRDAPQALLGTRQGKGTGAQFVLVSLVMFV